MTPPRIPQHGDTVYIPNYPRGGSGEWLGGVIQNLNTDAVLIVGVRGHFSGCMAVKVLPSDYLEGWCLPEDVGMPEIPYERV